MIDLLSGWSVVMLIGCLFGLMSDGFEHLNVMVYVENCLKCYSMVVGG